MTRLDLLCSVLYLCFVLFTAKVLDPVGFVLGVGGLGEAYAEVLCG